MSTEPTLAEILNNPEEHYPGNFDTPERANALLTGLCQDAATEIDRLNRARAEQPRVRDKSGTDYEKLHAKWRKGRQELSNLTRAHEALLAKVRAEQPASEPDYWLGYGLQAYTEKPFEGATPVWTSPPARGALLDLRKEAWKKIIESETADKTLVDIASGTKGGAQ